MAFDISLSAGMRADLISLQGTAQLLNRTQGRLSSGKQVNSAVDDPSRYFAAQDHVNHAGDLSARKSDMGEAIAGVKAANHGITGITSLINQAQGLVQSAGSANATTRASLAAQFNTLRDQIDQLASDSGYNGKNFLHSDSLKVLFNESGSSLLIVKGFEGNSSGLGITTAAHSTGTTYAGENLAATSVAKDSTVTLANSGIVHKEDITVSRTLAYSAQSLATKTAAAAVSGKSIALTHAGAASSVTVSETLTKAKTAAISSANATAGAVSGGNATFTVSATMSAMPTTFNVTTTQTVAHSAEALAGTVSATTLSGQTVTLQHMGAASNVTVSETIAFSGSAAISSANANTASVSAGSATFTVSATMTPPARSAILVRSNGVTLTAGVSYTASVSAGGVTITLLTAQARHVDVSFNYDKTVASSGYTLSTGTSTTAGSITFNRDLTGAVKVNYTSTESGVALGRGSAYTATFNASAGTVTISLLQAQTNHVDVSVDYKKTLSSTTDYTLSAGTSASAGRITFKKNFSGAVTVDFKATTTVATGGYTIASGSTKSAGSLTFNAKITGEVQVNYSVNHTLWGNDAAIQTDIDNLNTAITKLRTQAASMAANLSVITTRQEWSASMISNLQTGSDNLTLADMNEEGANMLALQTRQQLGIQALSLASQANQSVMRLFG